MDLVINKTEAYPFRWPTFHDPSQYQVFSRVEKGVQRISCRQKVILMSRRGYPSARFRSTRPSAQKTPEELSDPRLLTSSFGYRYAAVSLVLLSRIDLSMDGLPALSYILHGTDDNSCHAHEHSRIYSVGLFAYF